MSKKVVIEGHPKKGTEIKREGKKDGPPQGPQILDGRRGERGVKILDRRPKDG